MSILAEGNGREGRKQWWQYMPIPESWYLSGSDDRYRDREPIDLDDTRSMRRRFEDNPPPPPQPRLQVPIGVIVTIMIYLVGQLVGSVWWAAKLESNLQHEIADRSKEEARLWDGIQTYRAEVGALRVEVARLTGNRKLKEEE